MERQPRSVDSGSRGNGLAAMTNPNPYASPVAAEPEPEPRRFQVAWHHDFALGCLMFALSIFAYNRAEYGWALFDAFAVGWNFRAAIVKGLAVPRLVFA
jgi:hypothetical protein